MRRSKTVCVWVALSTVANGSVAAQSENLNDETRVIPEARRLVVNVEAQGDGGADSGAGIIFGVSAARDSVYIATARHVVTHRGVRALSAQIRYSWQPNQFVEASLLPQIDTAMDLAVLAVPADESVVERIESSFDRLGRVSDLKPVDRVSPVGCPGGSCWGTGPSDQVMAVDPASHRLLFSSFFVTPGSSGGALFNEWWEVVGMVTRDNPPLGEALVIEGVLDRVREWGFPVRLKRPGLPRRGYPISVGVVVMAGLNEQAFPASRLPSGRVDFSVQIARLGESMASFRAHGGVLRLTTSDVSINAAVVGVSVPVRKDRVTVRPFIEGGVGQTDARYVAETFTDLTTSQPIPFFRTVDDTSLGFGAGVSAEVVVMPRSILQLTVGHWNFTLPDPSDSSNPSVRVEPLPSVTFGIGMRFGL